MRLRVLLLVGLMACAPRRAVVAPSTGASAVARPWFDAVRLRFDGERAKRVVAFMEQYWRVPANVGFTASVAHVESIITAAGFVDERSASPRDRLTYRVESRPGVQTWEPDSASLTIVGQSTPVLRWATNRNMLAINSLPTPPSGIEAEVVMVSAVADSAFARVDVRGRIVHADAPVSRLFAEAVQKRGAIGVLAYNMPVYTKPSVHRRSIQFSSIPLDTVRRSFGILLSYDARENLRRALAAGPVRVRVGIAARSFQADEHTLIADVRGSVAPNERWVFSAHVQEPGANDDASGVGTQAEMARVLAALVRDGTVDPKRTITFIWGTEISAPQRYLAADEARTRDIRWGMSLDMVGENTAVTGGTFLIEKMPDPSAVWTRGEDKHSEWGGSPLKPEEIVPHYFNDFVLRRCLDQAATNGWIVRTNPYEGGSDHVPFLRAKKPGILLWHFTDEFYHTDGDRLDKVSAQEMTNVGVAALVSAVTLTSADGATARAIVAEVERAAMARLDAELQLSRNAVAEGGDRAKENTILRTWGTYYRDAIRAAADIEVGGSSDATRQAIDAAATRVERAASERVTALDALRIRD
jgi:aminopeptidase YwaD